MSDMIVIKVESATGGYILINGDDSVGDEKCVATSLHALKETFADIVQANLGSPATSESGEEDD